MHNVRLLLCFLELEDVLFFFLVLLPFFPVEEGDDLGALSHRLVLLVVDLGHIELLDLVSQNNPLFLLLFALFEVCVCDLLDELRGLEGVGLDLEGLRDF